MVNSNSHGNFDFRWHRSDYSRELQPARSAFAISITECERTARPRRDDFQADCRARSYPNEVAPIFAMESLRWRLPGVRGKATLPAWTTKDCLSFCSATVSLLTCSILSCSEFTFASRHLFKHVGDVAGCSIANNGRAFFRDKESDACRSRR